MGFGTPLGGLPMAREGKIKALAVTSLQRTSVAPDIPTMAESGFPGFDIVVWWGLMAPAKTPPAIINKLYQESTRVLTLPEVHRTRLRSDRQYTARVCFRDYDRSTALGKIYR